MSKSITFLTYLARSGSTYLASKLDACDGVGVGIEARFCDGWTTPGFSIENEEELGTYLQELYENEKFLKWGVEPSVLQEKLEKLAFPVLFSDILCLCLDEYFKDQSLAVHVHKRGDYFKCVGEILTELPSAKFLFIDRDPRAIYNSQSKSLDSKTQKPMMSDIVHFVLEYEKEQRQLEAARSLNCLYVISYEKFLMDEPTELDKALSFLGVSSRGHEAGNTKYFDSIPDAQKHLHQHVKSGAPVLDRIDGWKKELRPADIVFLNIVLARKIVSKGYSSGKKFCTQPQELKMLGIHLLRYSYEKIKRSFF